MTPPISAGGSWTHRVLHSFAGGSDGASPYAGVTIGIAGELYGTTRGNLSGTAGYGTVFSLTPPTYGDSWTHRVLHNFAGGSDGANPYAGVVFGWNGVLYGTTYSGGSSCPSCGTVFSLTPPLSTGGTWTEKILYNFVGGADGAIPYAGVAIGSGSVLFGTTQSGGANCSTCPGPHGGTVFAFKYR